MMTRKHHQQLATILGEHLARMDAATIHEADGFPLNRKLSDALDSLCTDDNPRFDSERFHDAVAEAREAACVSVDFDLQQLLNEDREAAAALWMPNEEGK